MSKKTARQKRYHKYLKSDHWKSLRAAKQSEFRRKHRGELFCCVCESKAHLDIHHVVYRRLLDVKLSDLRVVCRECHKAAHALLKRKKWRKCRKWSAYRIWKAMSVAVASRRGVTLKKKAPAVWTCPPLVPGYWSGEDGWGGLGP